MSYFHPKYMHKKQKTILNGQQMTGKPSERLLVLRRTVCLLAQQGGTIAHSFWIQLCKMADAFSRTPLEIRMTSCVCQSRYSWWTRRMPSATENRMVNWSLAVRVSWALGTTWDVIQSVIFWDSQRILLQFSRMSPACSRGLCSGCSFTQTSWHSGSCSIVFRMCWLVWNLWTAAWYEAWFGERKWKWKSSSWYMWLKPCKAINSERDSITMIRQLEIQMAVNKAVVDKLKISVNCCKLWPFIPFMGQDQGAQEAKQVYCHWLLWNHVTKAEQWLDYSNSWSWLEATEAIPNIADREATKLWKCLMSKTKANQKPLLHMVQQSMTKGGMTLPKLRYMCIMCMFVTDYPILWYK